MASVVSTVTESRLREAFTGSRKVLGRDLVKHLGTHQVTRQAAHMAIGNAVGCGLLQRSGDPGLYAYTLNPAWVRPIPGEVRVRDAQRAGEAQRQTLACRWPAFGDGRLVPALGLRPADPEVMPPEVATIVDGLHQRFYRHTRGAEA